MSNFFSLTQKETLSERQNFTNEIKRKIDRPKERDKTDQFSRKKH